MLTSTIQDSLSPRRMFPMGTIDKNHPLCGTWIAPDEDTDDYPGTEYTISVADGTFVVSAVDRSDNEAFVISDVEWDGEWLSFRTLMPSTERRGHARVRYVDTNDIEFLFTFTVKEFWKRKLRESN